MFFFLLLVKEERLSVVYRAVCVQETASVRGSTAVSKQILLLWDY